VKEVVALLDLDAQLASAEFLTDPYPTLTRLRTDEPVFWSEAWKAWLISRYDDCLAGMRDYKEYSNLGRRQVVFDQLPPDTRAKVEPLSRHFSGGMGNVDPPEHSRLRKLVSRAFTPSAIAAWRTRVEHHVEDLLDQSYGVDSFDLIQQFAFPLPAITISELLGLPVADIDQLKAWSDDFTSFMGTGTVDPAAVETSLHAYVSARAWLLTIIGEHKATRPDDLISSLLSVGDAGDSLSDEEVVAMCFLLMVGGHQTTTNLIGSTMLLLLQNGEQMQLLRREPSLLRSAIEESLRFEAPFQQGWRVSTEDIEVGGRLVRRGQMLRFMIGAANRDPGRFEQPDRFDIARGNNRHLTFGSGIHACLGAPLARLEAEIALSRLLERFPGVRLADAHPDWNPDRISRGLRSLPLQLNA
jgi:cytochrome P450